MSSSSSTITVSVTTIAEVVLAVSFIAAVIVLARKPLTGSSEAASTASGSSAKKGKGKKKRAAITTTDPSASSASPAEPARSVTETSEVLKMKKSKKKAADAAIGSIGSSAAPKSRSAANPKEASKSTLAGSSIHHSDSASSPPALASSSTTSSSPSFAYMVSTAPSSTSLSPDVSPNGQLRYQSASKAVAVIDDMRDYELDPERTAPRVMKIVDAKSNAPTKEWLDWSEGPAARDDGEYDYGDATVAEASWEVAKPKKSTSSRLNIGTASPSSSFSASNPAPRSIPGLSSSNQAAMTKKQRENLKKSSRVAAEKEEAEREREERLRAHRKELERTRMMDQERGRAKARAKAGNGPRSENVAVTKKAPIAQASSKGTHGAGRITSDGLIWD